MSTGHRVLPMPQGFNFPYQGRSDSVNPEPRS